MRDCLKCVDLPVLLYKYPEVIQQLALAPPGRYRTEGATIKQVPRISNRELSSGVERARRRLSSAELRPPIRQCAWNAHMHVILLRGCVTVVHNAPLQTHQRHGDKGTDENSSVRKIRRDVALAKHPDKSRTAQALRTAISGLALCRGTPADARHEPRAQSRSPALSGRVNRAVKGRGTCVLRGCRRRDDAERSGVVLDQCGARAR